MPDYIPSNPPSFPSLKLEKLQFIHRHGERTFVTSRLEPFIPRNVWDQLYSKCKLTTHLHEELRKAGVEKGVTSHSHILPIHEVDAPSIRKVFIKGCEGPDCISIALKKLYEQAKEGQCGMGQLTDVGKNTMQNLGCYWRSVYVDKLGFLPDFMETDTLSLRSSDFARTFESLQYMVSGLYPMDKRHDTHALHITTRQEHEESLHALEPFCPRLKQLMRTFRKNVVSKMDLTEFAEAMKAYLPEDPAKRTNAFAIHDLYDHWSVLKAHGLPVLEGYGDKEFKVAEKFATKWWFQGYVEQFDALKLGMGPLIHDILQDNKRQGGPLAYVYSGHDTTIAPLLIAFGIFPGTWPSFAANLVIETWKGKDDKFVRLLYNGKPVELPACQAIGDHLASDKSLCTLNAFHRQMSNLALSPQAYANGCKSIEE